VQGHTVLGSGFAEVSEGYAMPIPPMTDHGFRNTTGHDHVVPFIFGSLPMTGWGVFFDVEPRPGQGQLVKHDLDSSAMNHSVYLERELRRVREAKTNTREVLIPAERAGSPEIGGLELAVTLVARGEVDLLSNHYRIVSIQTGKAHVRIGNAEKEMSAHDHFGVPADMNCRVAQSGNEPLLFLDAMILPITNT
jgi:mannose-6-phosphate isomerase-like protein (cupin superfamily)